MIKKIVYSFLALFLFSYCSEDKPDIQVACDITSSGNYLIKWETFPPLEGTVKIYESESPDSFSLSSPIAEVEIAKGFVDVLAIRNLNRSYFQLVFNKKYTVITSERTVRFPTIFNFRDLGGYYTNQNRQTRWGKLYRSSSLSETTMQDREFLDNLKIKTLIDLRTENLIAANPTNYSTENMYKLPLRGNRPNVFADKILSREMKRGDVLIYLQDVFYFFVENNSDYFTQMFDILLNESNYPLVIYCSLGSDRTGVASALILAALDINQEQIIKDYLVSNDQLNYTGQFPNAELFGADVQETMTALYRSHPETISYAFNQLIKEYGSIDAYFEKELDLTKKKREKLKELLLY